MIEVTRLNDTKLSINPYQIEMVEDTPDTIVLFASGRKIVVKEKSEQISKQITEFMSESVTLGIERSNISR
jgi:flagellar protein FlbD